MAATIYYESAPAPQVDGTNIVINSTGKVALGTAITNKLPTASPTSSDAGKVPTVQSNGTVAWAESGLSSEISDKLSDIDDKITDPTTKSDGQVLTYNGTSGAWEAKDSQGDGDAETMITNLLRRTRNDITSNLANLSTAVAQQNLEKYGYTIGDYFIGKSGYYYYLADPDHYYGGYGNNAVVSTHHIGIVVDTKTNSTWLSSGSATNYSASTLHSFLTSTALPLVKSDFTTLFGDWSSHLLCNTLLDNAIGGWGTTWTGLANCYIAAMSEVQVYGANVFSTDAYQTGTSAKQLELFRKYRWNEIYENTSIWLRSLNSSSYACVAAGSGGARTAGLAGSTRASGLILFH